MGRADLTLALLTPTLFGDQFGDPRTDHRNLLDILRQSLFLADRPLAVRTAWQVHPDLFVNGLGFGTVKSGVARLASRSARVRVTLAFRAAERGGLAMGLPLPLLK